MAPKGSDRNRREVLKSSLLIGTGIWGGALMDPMAWGRSAALLTRGRGGRPLMPWGVQFGDITPQGVTLWSASDRPAEMLTIRACGRGDAEAALFIKKCEEQKNGDAEELESLRMMLGS